VHASHLATRGVTMGWEGALALLEDHAGGSLDLKVLRRPRIVLIANEFPDTTMTAAVWLTQMGVEIVLVRYQAYRTPAGLAVTTSRIWPIEDVEDLVVRPEEREEAEEVQRERRRSRSVVARIVEAGLLQDGDPLTFTPAASQLPAALRTEVETWIAEEPGRGEASWVNANPRCLRWQVDGTEHSASGLAERIVEHATGRRVHTTGPMWWSDQDGNRLYDLLEAHTGEPVYAGWEGERDWSELHKLLEQLPEGRWTSYGDLAEAIGSSAIAVGQHVTSCPDCPRSAYRVLRNSGRVAENFVWDDGRDVDPMELLESEGVVFEGGRASEAQRMRW
jgi:alkylated DNA nucleotide flippase Atl1